MTPLVVWVLIAVVPSTHYQSGSADEFAGVTATAEMCEQYRAAAQAVADKARLPADRTWTFVCRREQVAQR